MKKYIQKEFDLFPCDEDGKKVCPTGDYSEIKFFGDNCSFEEDCRFGNRSSFGNNCWFGDGCGFGENCSFEGGKEAKPGYPFIAFVGAGSRPGSKVYFFNTIEGVYVRCGCWSGFISDFRERVQSTNADEIYLVICNVVEQKINS